MRLIDQHFQFRKKKKKCFKIRTYCRFPKFCAFPSKNLIRQNIHHTIKYKWRKKNWKSGERKIENYSNTNLHIKLFSCILKFNYHLRFLHKIFLKFSHFHSHTSTQICSIRCFAEKLNYLRLVSSGLRNKNYHINKHIFFSLLVLHLLCSNQYSEGNIVSLNSKW